MAYLNDTVLDAALAVLDTTARRIDICSAEPTTYAAATTTLSLGNKDFGSAGAAFGSPSDRSPSGRKVASTAVTDGAVTATGTATHWAVTDVANSRLLATGALSASQPVTSGNTFTLASFDIGIPDAA